MTPVHAADQNREEASVSGNTCQSVFTDSVKEPDSCSTPQKKVSSKAGAAAPSFRASWSAEQKMAPAATCAVTSLPPESTVVEPGVLGVAATTTGPAKRGIAFAGIAFAPPEQADL